MVSSAAPTAPVSTNPACQFQFPIDRLPNDIIPKVTGFVGAQWAASRQFRSDKTDLSVYSDIVVSYKEVLGEKRVQRIREIFNSAVVPKEAEKKEKAATAAEADVKSSAAASAAPKTPSQDPSNRNFLVSARKQLLAECRVMNGGEAFLNSLGDKIKGPILNPSIYKQITEWMLIAECKLLPGSQAFLESIQKEIGADLNGDAFNLNEDTFKRIDDWINDANLLIVANKLSTRVGLLEGTHHEKAEAARRLLPALNLFSVINCEYCGLTRVPPELFEFNDLHHLWLSKNYLTRFSAPAGAFSQLDKLSLCDNQLTQFTAAVGAFPLLQNLQLDRNKLTQFSVPAGAFPLLRNLQLARNQLTQFSVPAGAFQLLDYLDLNDNQLTQFMVPVGAFPKLTTLSLKNNPLPQFVIPIGAFPELKILTLEAPPVGVFPRLKELNLYKNQLDQFATHIGAFPQLQRLCVIEHTRTGGCIITLFKVYEGALTLVEKIIRV